MDGLAGGTSVFAFLSFTFIAAARGFPWLVVFCAAMVGALLALTEARGVEPQNLGIRRATLEDVFLELTGRALRD